MRRLDVRWLLAAAVAGYVLLAAAALAGLVAAGAAGADRAALTDALTSQLAVLAIGVVLALGGLVALVAYLIGRYTTGVRRLTADTRLLIDANPGHAVSRSGPGDVIALAGVVDELAQRRRAADQAVGEQIAAARASLEEERNRLAALMAELGAAVLVCNDEGRILLYNAAAKSVLGDDAAVGLGRSVFGIVDRDLLAHALERIGDNTDEGGGVVPHVSTTLRGEQLLQVQVAPARGPDGSVTGYVLLLEDQTERVGRAARREELVREVTEGTRSSLGSIQAAIENVLEYPDMDTADRQEFLGIVREECARLGHRVQEWVSESDVGFGTDWPSTEMSVDDLLAVVARTLERDVGLGVAGWDGAVGGGPDPLWVKVDSHSVTRAIAHLADRLRADAGVGTLNLVAGPIGSHIQIDLCWRGRAPSPALSQAWLDEPLTGAAAVTAREVVARHGGEIWCDAIPRSDGGGDGGRLRLLLPLTEPVRTPEVRPRLDIASRPEFYDFGLFEQHAGANAVDDAWSDRDLGELSYTVFDTETTGLYPDNGDRIISIGAVRIVNGRLLHSDTYERLVDPGRSVPAQSTAVHGLTTAMVRGQPSIDVVLPTFDRFSAETVLVGHNAGFDMQFLALERQRVGLPAAQPIVLDTLLLDAAVHPDHDEHSLEAIAGRLGVDVLGRHTALGDALVTGEVFIRLVAVMRSRGIRTLGEAVAASRATLQARLDESFYGS